MTDQDPWKQLREPFPPERVLKLPATSKRPELDYVSHADVTDRLLTVDPMWSWEWGVNDPQTGLPSKDLSLTREGDEWVLWMALTVCGNTKRDVGYAPAVDYRQDGTPYPKSEALKHAVSDALRRCAMRFGVALDLWEKADTVTTGEGGRRGASSASAPPCPQCGGALRERNGAKGPFVGCSNYPNCRFTTNGTLDQFQSEADVEPEDVNIPVPPVGDLTAQIVALAKEAGPDATLNAFRGAGAAQCLSMSADGTYRMRKSELDKLSTADKEALVDALSIPF